MTDQDGRHSDMTTQSFCHMTSLLYHADLKRGISDVY